MRKVYIRILDNEWNVYRRYTEFRELHTHLRTQFAQVDTFNFPPKKAIWNKTARPGKFRRHAARRDPAGGRAGSTAG
ncbi:Sorting nexin-29 [Liparis tanakae]|uniref:Sorting nexin-29 n=1 Tax=Liparis tanakae TaxID=230148 RepID=A0A4Z2F0Z4_9TELE|nr:Sorting nexin-29 [Liparis tanakae]